MGAGASSQAPPRYKWSHDPTLRGPWTFLFKEKVQCACEGSKWCTRENPAKQKTENAIPGLHSSWVGDMVLAMARPWQSHVAQFQLVEAFKKVNIGMILNLQEVGEHASCGPGNLPHSGFTYDPETFMAAGIGYYNFSWRDMGVPSLDRMMDIVQVMDYVTRVEGRKIAVHCHAGLGRTGLAIACFLIFSRLHDTPEAAIAAVRKNRIGAVQTSRQVAFVSIFAQYLQHLRCVFPVQVHLSNGPQQKRGSPPGSNSATNLSASVATEAGAQGGLLETRSSPPGSLPQEGLLESKETGSALVGVYSSGLTVSVPLQTSASAAPEGAAPSDVLTEADLGLSQHLPWNDAFQIEPQHAAAFRPHPPRSYTEALARQARLLHGPERRAFLRLHKVVKETVFAIIAAANSFQSTNRSPTRALLSLPAIPEESSPLQRTKSAAAALAAALAAAGDGNTGGSPQAPPLPPTFAHLLSYLIAHHGPSHIDSDALAPLMAHKAFAAAVGPQLESRAVLEAVSKLRQELNSGSYIGLEHAPLLTVLMLLEAFFANFRSGSEPSSLTSGCLSVISQSYRDLFNSTPSGPNTADPSSTGPATTGDTAGFSTSLEHARQAYEILEPLEPRDSELLLVFAAMLRVVARSSGPGAEDAVVEVGQWATGLLLGKLRRIPEAEEAVLSFLWYLAGRDEAYAMLVLLKRQRITGQFKRSKAGSGAADVAAMLQATAVSLAAPPTPTQLPPPGSAEAALGDNGVSAAIAAAAAAVAATAAATGSGGSVTSTLVAPLPSGEAFSTEGESALQSPAGGNSGDMANIPALQMAQLLSQDLQHLYRLSFREALAGISTVVYPPPLATGRIDVHDVWR